MNRSSRLNFAQFLRFIVALSLAPLGFFFSFLLPPSVSSGVPNFEGARGLMIFYILLYSAPVFILITLYLAHRLIKRLRLKQRALLIIFLAAWSSWGGTYLLLDF